MHLRILEIENFRGIRKLHIKLNVITAIFGEGSFGKTTLVDALSRCLIDEGRHSIIPEFSDSDFHNYIRQEKSNTADQGIDEQAHLRIKLTFRESFPEQWSALLEKDLFTLTREWKEGYRQLSFSLDGSIRNNVDRNNDDRNNDDRNRDKGIKTRCSFLSPDGSTIMEDPEGERLSILRRHVPLTVLEPALQYFCREVETQTANSHFCTMQDIELYRAALKELPSGFSQILTPQLEILAGCITSTDIHSMDKLGVGKNNSLEQQFPNHIFSKLSATLALLRYISLAKQTKEWAQGAQPILISENLESNIHPIVLASLWNLLAQMPVQKILVTNSGELLSSVPLHSLRRASMNRNELAIHSIGSETLDKEDIRRIGYHLRLNRQDAILNRCWLLVEGESEFWLLPELAQIMGYDFKAEGIRCIEFAQCGAEPLIRLARDLSIEWHLLADGDQPGQVYAKIARNLAGSKYAETRVTLLPDHDIEHHLCKNGFASVYARAAGPKHDTRSKKQNKSGALSAMIARAVKRNPKPDLILKAAERAAQLGRESVPPVLRIVIEKTISLARQENIDRHH